MTKEIRQIPIWAIKPDPAQPRKDFDEDELQELAQSIHRNGLLSPITVKTNGDGEHIIIAGERRYRAHQILDTETIECIVYNGSNGKELQLIENINRKDLNYMELAEAYRSYLDWGAPIFSTTYNERLPALVDNYGKAQLVIGIKRLDFPSPCSQFIFALSCILRSNASSVAQGVNGVQSGSSHCRVNARGKTNED